MRRSAWTFDWTERLETHLEVQQLLLSLKEGVKHLCGSADTVQLKEASFWDAESRTRLAAYRRHLKNIAAAEGNREAERLRAAEKAATVAKEEAAAKKRLKAEAAAAAAAPAAASDADGDGAGGGGGGGGGSGGGNEASPEKPSPDAADKGPSAPSTAPAGRRLTRKESSLQGAGGGGGSGSGSEMTLRRESTQPLLKRQDSMAVKTAVGGGIGRSSVSSRSLLKANTAVLAAADDGTESADGSMKQSDAELAGGGEVAALLGAMTGEDGEAARPANPAEMEVGNLDDEINTILPYIETVLAHVHTVTNKAAQAKRDVEAAAVTGADGAAAQPIGAGRNSRGTALLSGIRRRHVATAAFVFRLVGRTAGCPHARPSLPFVPSLPVSPTPRLITGGCNILDRARRRQRRRRRRRRAPTSERLWACHASRKPPRQL